jgi:phosphotriesterase-related protein
MGQVNTVRGPIDGAGLGTTLMHEHVFILSPDVQQNYPLGWDDARRIDDAVTRLNELKSRGVDSIVDLTVLGLGRYVPRIAAIAARTELQIVVATGLYTYNDVPLYFSYRGPGTPFDGPEPMIDMFVRDLQIGIAETDVKAGILKCATDEAGVTPGVERVLLAVAEAHRQTGAPISTHTHAPTRQGLEQQRIFAKEGVDLERVVIGHSGDSTDLAYLEELVGNGSYIGMDRFGIDAILSFDERVATVATMCERGHANRMVLSHDAACHNDWFEDEMVTAVQPNWRYTHISDDVIPALRARGVTDDQLRQMLVENPMTILGSRTG